MRKIWNTMNKDENIPSKDRIPIDHIIQITDLGLRDYEEACSLFPDLNEFNVSAVAKGSKLIPRGPIYAKPPI